MFKFLRCKKGQSGIELIPIIFWAVAGTMAVATMTIPAIYNPHRAQKAVDICQCREAGNSEYFCKSEAAVDFKVNPVAAEHSTCQANVDVMTKAEILDFIQDDVVMPAGKNYGNIN